MSKERLKRKYNYNTGSRKLLMLNCTDCGNSYRTPNYRKIASPHNSKIIPNWLYCPTCDKMVRLKSRSDN